MKQTIPIIIGLVLPIMGCANSSFHTGNSDSSSDTQSLATSLVGDDKVSTNPMFTDSLLIPFEAVIDTLNSEGDCLVHSDYFLHDITGDGQPELWIVSGTCEADKDLWVYATTQDGSVKKILSDYGGHTEFFLKGNTIGSLTCNTGSGYASVYTCKGDKIIVESAEYDGRHEKDMVKIKSKRDRFIADVWENSDSTINLKPLK